MCERCTPFYPGLQAHIIPHMARVRCVSLLSCLLACLFGYQDLAGAVLGCNVFASDAHRSMRNTSSDFMSISYTVQVDVYKL